MNFRQAVKKAAKEAKLTLTQRMKLQVVMMIPTYREELHDKLFAKAVELSVVPASSSMDSAFADNFDWEKFKEFIIEWLPIILKLIIMFL